MDLCLGCLTTDQQSMECCFDLLLIVHILKIVLVLTLFAFNCLNTALCVCTRQNMPSHVLLSIRNEIIQ